MFINEYEAEKKLKHNLLICLRLNAALLVFLYSVFSLNLKADKRLFVYQLFEENKEKRDK